MLNLACAGAMGGQHLKEEAILYQLLRSEISGFHRIAAYKAVILIHEAKWD